MATRVGALRAELSADSARFEADLQKASRSLRQFSSRSDRQLGRVDRAFKRGLASAGAFAKRLISLRGIVATLAGGAGLGLLVRNATRTAATIADTADKIGLSTDALQEFRFAAAQTGVAQQQLDLALQRFSRRVGEAVVGTGELKDTLRQYDIAVRNSDGSTRSFESVISDYADAIKNASSEQEALRLAFKAFDSEGAALVNLMRQGRDGVAEFRAEAHAAGAVMREDLVRQGKELDARMKALGQTLSTIVNTAILENAELIEDLVVAFTKIVPKILEAARAFGVLVGAIEPTTEELRESVREADELEKRLDGLKGENPFVRAEIDRRRDALFEREFPGGRRGVPPGALPTRSALPFDPLLGTNPRPFMEKGNGGQPPALPSTAAERNVPLPPDITRRQAQAARDLAAVERMQENIARATARVADAQRTARDVAEQYNEELREQGRAIRDDVATPTEEYNQRMKELRELLRAGAIDEETFGRAVKKATKEMEDANRELDRFGQLATEAFRAFGDGIAGAIERGEGFKGVLRAIGAEMIRVLSDADRLREILGGFGGGSSGGGTLADIFGLISSSGGSGMDRAQLAGSLNPSGFFGAARGADFTVPSGFPNDSFTLGVSSGEHVRVDPNGRQGTGPTVMIDARGADASGIARLERIIRDINGTIERRAVTAVVREQKRAPARFRTA